MEDAGVASLEPGERSPWLGKVMSSANAATEFAQIQRLLAVDPHQDFGIYAALGKPRVVRTDADALAVSAGGDAELAKCTVLQDIPRADLRQLVMRRAEGGDMASVLERARNAPASAHAQWSARLASHLAAFATLVRGLAAYHAHGIVHQDVKPANAVLVGGTWDSGAPRLEYKFIDFGVAEEPLRLVAAGKELGIAGTLVFMAPATEAAVFRLDAAATAMVVAEAVAAVRVFAGRAMGTGSPARAQDPAAAASDAVVARERLLALLPPTAGPGPRALAFKSYSDRFALAFTLCLLCASLVPAAEPAAVTIRARAEAFFAAVARATVATTADMPGAYDELVRDVVRLATPGVHSAMRAPDAMRASLVRPQSPRSIRSVRSVRSVRSIQSAISEPPSPPPLLPLPPLPPSPPSRLSRSSRPSSFVSR
jgi:serine/threonine protein kinase